MDRQRYFSSSIDEYNFPQVRPQSYLYIYKHNYPQIIVRFPQPTKTITGYRLYQTQIFYHPFYQELDQQNSKNSHQKYKKSTKMQKLKLDYQGEIILSLQISIFNQYFQQEVLNYLKQCQSQNQINLKKILKTHKKPANQHSFHLDPNMYSQDKFGQYPQISDKKISQIFKILLKQWLKEPLISSMFIISEKHLQTVESYDHGFIKLQILKTSDKTLKVPFHRYMIQRNWTLQQISNYDEVYQNKIYYFQFQSSIFFTQNHDYHDVQKLGFVVPNPITINQFFYQTLLMIFGQFQAAQKQKQDKKKRQEERIKNREALLQNLRKIGIQGQLPDLNNFQQDNKEPLAIQDSLDKKLQQLLSKDRQNKNLLKNISYVKGEMSYTEHLSTFHNHNQSYFQNSPRRRLSTKLSDMRQDDPKQDESKINRYKSPTLKNVKVIRSFTSELLEQDFQQKPKRRFITRQQYLKILEFNQRLMKKKQEKQKKVHTEQNKANQQPKKQKQQIVYVGPENSPTKSSMKKNQSKVNNDRQFKYDFFAMHQEKIISKDEPLKEPMKYSWEEDDEFYSYDHSQDSQQISAYRINQKNHSLGEYEQYQRKNGFQLNSSFIVNYDQ